MYPGIADRMQKEITALAPSSRSRSSLLPRGSTPYGSVGPSWHLCQPSNRCGSQSKNTTSPAPPLSTESASKPQTEEAPGPIEVQLLLSNILKLSLIISVWFNGKTL